MKNPSLDNATDMGFADTVLEDEFAVFRSKSLNGAAAVLPDDEYGVFRPVSRDSLNMIAAMNRNGKPMFVIPTKYSSAEAAQVGYLLNQLLASARRGGGDYKSFFCNSQFEALQGAIKIIRHYACNYTSNLIRPFGRGDDATNRGRCVIHCAQDDPVNFYGNKTATGGAIAFLPGVEWINDRTEFIHRLETRTYAACIVRLDRLHSWSGADIALVRELCSLRNRLFGLDVSNIPIYELKELFEQLPINADVYIWGERLTDREIPFGAFSMSPRVYKPWNNLNSGFLHSSTYSGNLVALSKVKSVLLSDLFAWTETEHDTLHRIEHCADTKRTFFARFVNPSIPKLYGFLGYDFAVRAARGCYFEVEDRSGERRRILDGVSGGAMGIFGHNPGDLEDEVLSRHQGAISTEDSIVSAGGSIVSAEGSIVGAEGSPQFNKAEGPFNKAEGSPLAEGSYKKAEGSYKKAEGSFNKSEGSPLAEGSQYYWRQFSEKIKTVTGFDHVFAAVSGASAVETAMMLALLGQYSQSEANAELTRESSASMEQPSAPIEKCFNRKKIIVFKHNYSGKLLLPLIASHDSDQNDTRYFHPLYADVVTIDAFSPGAVESLTAEIHTGEVALIWFEYIQGQTGKRLPGELIEVIKKNHETHGYYIGVDEILMGMYRGGTFFSYAGTGLSPDIVTLSKGLSYMSYPTGVTLVESKVYENALKTCSKTVQWLQSRYINSLGAHIALHCLHRLEREGIAANVETRSAALREGLNALIARGGLIQKAETTGLMLHLSYRTPWWIRLLGKPGRMAYLLLLTKFWLKQDVFVFFDSRIAPSLCLSADEVETFLEKAKKLAAASPLKIVFDGILKK